MRSKRRHRKPPATSPPGATLTPPQTRAPLASPQTHATLVSAPSRALLLTSLVAASLLLLGCGRVEVTSNNNNSRSAANASPASNAAQGGGSDAATRGDGHARADGGGVAPTEQTPAPAASQTVAPTAAPSEDDGDAGGEFGGTTGGVEVKSKGGGVATLTGVRVARHEGYDRVVFEFGGGALPGYSVAYAGGAVRKCGSGDAARVAGGGRLKITLTPARAHDDAGRSTIDFRERSFDHPAVRELENVCDFEAELSWALGVASRREYRVRELGGPARLVIDIKH